MTPRITFSHWTLLMSCLALGLFAAGCKTTSASGSKVTTSIIVLGHSPAEVLSAAKDVFVSHGYEVIPAPGMSLTFEKKGNSMDNLLYGNWMDHVYLRACVTVVELRKNECALDCNAYYVRDPGAGMVEEQQSRPGEGPYRKMLEEVARKFAFSEPPR